MTGPSQWGHRATSDCLPPEAVTRLVHLRRLMLVHSCIYYRLNDSVVTDHQWQEWANELRDLQDACVENRCVGFYDSEFFDWDGSTGYHLPADEGVLRTARALLANPFLPRNRKKLQARRTPKRRRLFP